MRKGKKPQKNTQPGKRKGPVENKDSGSEEEFERQTQEDAELVPPARRPPTAVGAGTPPLPPRPSGPSRSTPEPYRLCTWLRPRGAPSVVYYRSGCPSILGGATSTCTWPACQGARSSVQVQSVRRAGPFAYLLRWGRTTSSFAGPTAWRTRTRFL